MTNFLHQETSSRVTSLISFLALIIFLPFLIFATLETVKLISRASGTKATITVDTSAKLEPISTDFYHAFSQGGEESTDMLAPVLSEIKALKPKIIRLDHLYDHYDVVGRSGQDLTFNFSQLDRAVDSIIATGAKPLLALSFMPSVIAKDGGIINPPNDWNEWALVVQRTIEHYSGRNAKNIQGVYYEVWNEPDLGQFGSWKMGGEKSYLTLYRYAALGASRAKGTHPFSLGGPSTTGLYKNWIIGLVKSGLRIDFFSWHTYQADPKKYDEDQKNLISWLLQYPTYAVLPTLITEFGFTGSKHKGYGTTYAAAHTGAVIRQLISGGPSYAFTFQPKDGPGQENGEGWGLVTHETNGKKTKPRYHVFSFLDAMAGTRLVVLGEGTWVTGFASERDGVIRLFLVNFDQNGNHTETVPITFTNLTPGTYTYRERFLFGRDVKFTERIENTSLQKQLFMPAQSMAILELTRTQ